MKKGSTKNCCQITHLDFGDVIWHNHLALLSACAILHDISNYIHMRHAVRESALTAK